MEYIYTSSPTKSKSRASSPRGIVERVTQDLRLDPEFRVVGGMPVDKAEDIDRRYAREIMEEEERCRADEEMARSLRVALAMEEEEEVS